MTEHDWLAGTTDLTTMLSFLGSKASERKLRLFAVAYCRRIWRLLPVACACLVDALESFADGLVSFAEYQTAWDRAEAEALNADRDPPDARTYATASVCISYPPTARSVASAADTAASALASDTAQDVTDHEYSTVNDAAWMQERGEQIRLVSEIFGNPFRPVTINPAWLTSTVVTLATSIYEDRAFDRLPILADALEDAGCDNADLLNHCRQPGNHVRGCWAVDLLLGRQ